MPSLLPGCTAGGASSLGGRGAGAFSGAAAAFAPGTTEAGLAATEGRHGTRRLGAVRVITMVGVVRVMMV